MTVPHRSRLRRALRFAHCVIPPALENDSMFVASQSTTHECVSLVCMLAECQREIAAHAAPAFP